MRDDFTQSTKEKLAHRAGYKCSKADCAIPTRGADSHDGTINLGEAAHITAASPGGPRYDPRLTSEQRRDHTNGIWLCGTHAKLVDSDESHFTVEELRRWKHQAELESFNEVVSSGARGRGRSPASANVGSATDVLIGAAKADLAAFQRMPAWPPHAISLNLRMVDENGSQSFSVSGLGAALETFDQISVIAPPGTGKTTTLLQLAGSILDAGSSVAVFVPLSEWSTRSDTFFQVLSRRAAFRDIDIRMFESLAQHGKLILILDGWNELDETSRKRARNEVKALERDFPDTRLVISSRDQEFDLPISGPVVQVAPLAEDQQLEIARAMRGSEGEALMEHAWRTSGLRELVAIPLYLSVLLKHAPGGSLPTTKEEVLRTFVREHEQDPEKAATLRRELQDYHPEILQALASEATYQGTTALSDAQARSVVNRVQERLRTDQQITLPLQPLNVLDVLVSVHALVRSGTEAGGVSFQHQQFQEWYASFRVERHMRSALRGDASARKTLREDVLDVPFWEEPILFACDRMSRSDDEGVRAVSDAIVEALGIDPLLSAEMIYRSSDAVWAMVNDKAVAFAEAWHKDGRVDRAVQFMINTGRAEFASYIWPLISNPDSQVHLRALRAGRRFRTTVLGPDVEKRISGLSDELRAHILSEIARESGMDGIELATRLARSDPSARVKIAVIESLQFRRGDRWTTEILQTASDEVWRAIAEKWDVRYFTDPNVAARIKKEAQSQLSEQTDPRRIIGSLLTINRRDPETGRTIGKLLEEVDFSDRKQDNSSLVHEAYELYPNEVAKALVVQLENGRRVPFRSEEWLRTSSIQIDEGPLVQRIMQSTANDNDAAAAVSVVGSKVIGELIDQYVEVHTRLRAARGKYDKALIEDNRRLSDLIEKSRLSSFISALLERSDTSDPERIAILADLLSGHGRDVKRGLLALDATTHQTVSAAVAKWGEALLVSPIATRTQLADVAQAVERLASPALVPVLEKLLAQDLVRWKKAKDEFLEARKKGLDNDAQMSWTLQYQRAFAAIGDPQTVAIMKRYLPHRQFGVDAAHVLRSIWDKSQPAQDERAFLRPSPDFSVIPERHKKRSEEMPIETVEFVDDILAVVDGLIEPASDADSQKHALKLAAVAFSMPYADKVKTIEALLALPCPTGEKQRLLTILALSGQIIPSSLVLQGIDELLEQAKTNPWMLQEQQGWRLNEWLRLLPFTDNVGAVLKVLDRLEPQYKLPWNFGGLLSALTYSSSDEAETVLQGLATRDPRFLQNHDWLAALTKRSTLNSARILLDFVSSESFPTERGALDGMGLGRDLAALMNAHAEFRDEVYRRYGALHEGRAKATLGYAIAEAPDVQGVLLLVRNAGAAGKPFRQTPLHTALRNILVEQRPSGTWAGMQELVSVPASELRRELFTIVVNGSAPESELAAKTLTVIDQMRDDYGDIETERRHPDITRGVPWPQIAASNQKH